jgi:hypothetical protein
MVEKFLRTAVVVAAVIVAGYHLVLEGRSIALETPMGCPETIYCAIAKAWPSEYQPGHFVEAQDNYGPAYSLLCRPFQAAGLGIYTAARVANLACILSAIVLLALVLARLGCPAEVIAAGCAVFYALNAGSYSIQARPDFVAMLTTVGLLAFAQPTVMGRMRTLPAGAVLGVLSLIAYFAKPYCVLAWGTSIAFGIGAALIRRQELARALSIAGISAAVIAVGIALFAAFNPYYLLETVFFHTSYFDASFSWLVLQMRDFGAMTCGLWVVAALGWRAFANPRSTAPSDASFWLWTTGTALLALVLVMGWHQGSYLTYFFHYLLAPIVVVAGLASLRVPVRWRALALLVNLWAVMQFAPELPVPDKGWTFLRQDVLAQRGTVLIDFLLEPLSRERPDTWVAGTGNNWIAGDQLKRVRAPLPIVATARSEADTYVARCVADIAHGQLPDCIYLDAYPVPAGTPGRAATVKWMPRNRSPLIDAFDLNLYREVGVFQIHPYYGSATMPRSDAGKLVAYIVKYAKR